MDIASLVLSIIALTLSIGTLVVVLAKHFSTHKIQMVPLDHPMSHGGDVGPGRPFSPESNYADFEDPLSDDEKEYFDKQKNK